MSEFKHIGKSYAMFDAVEKSQGLVKYICDMKLPNMMHAYLVTSTAVHANIKKIDVSKAEEVEGVFKVYTHENTPTEKFNSYRWIDGLAAIDDERLLNEKVRYYGDRIAMVVATTRDIAKKASSLIEVEYEHLEPILSIEQSKTTDIKVHDFDNKLYDGGFSCGDATSKFDDAAYVVKFEGTTPKVSHSSMETHTALANYDINTNSLTVYSPSQISHAVQKVCADITGLDLASVRSIKTKMGGSFGGKTHPIPEQLVAYAAHDLKGSVSLVFDRSQTITSSRTRTETKGYAETALDKDGKILARKIHLDFDSGAYATNIETVCIAAGKKSFRLYDIAHQEYTYGAYVTNKTISGACRGYGSPQIHVYTETSLNIAAEQLGIDPVEIRKRNLVDPFTNDPTNGPNLGNVQIKKALDKGAQLFKWEERKEKIANQKPGRFKRGIGVACASHGNGYFPAYPDFITIYMTLNTYGEVEVKAAIHDQGCGTLTTMQQIVAESMNVSMGRVKMCEADTAITPFDSAGTQACRVTFVIGKAMDNAAQELKGKFLSAIKEFYGSNKVDIIDDYVVVDSKKYDIKEMVQTLRKQKQFDPAILYTYHSHANPASTGVNFVEVEVDTYSGNVKVIDSVQVHDIGRVINLKLSESQVHGGIQMGLGPALSEEYKYNDKGELLNKNFSRYHVFNSYEMPNITTAFIEGDEPEGPFGAKSLGEVCTIPITPAVISAVASATGVWISELPITPEKLLKKL